MRDDTDELVHKQIHIPLNEFNDWCPWCRLAKAEQRIAELIRAIKEHREAIHSGRITVHEADARLWALETQQTPAARAASEGEE